MTIENAAPAVQLNLLRRTRIAVNALQRFAEREDALTALQAVPIDPVVQALAEATLAAGFSGLSSTSSVIQNGDPLVVKSGGSTYSGTAAVVDSALSVNLAATDAIVRSGLHAIPVTGTGTKLTITVAAGKVTAFTLSV